MTHNAASVSRTGLNLAPESKIADDLIRAFVVKFGYCRAQEEMAKEILILADQIEVLARQVSAGYVRRNPEAHHV